MIKNFKNGAGREYWVCGTEPGHQERQVGKELPEDDTLQNHHCKNLKSYIALFEFDSLTHKTIHIKAYTNVKTNLVCLVVSFPTHQK
jgi:hypothetical protein